MPDQVTTERRTEATLEAARRDLEAARATAQAAPTLEECARHEAAHAVAGVALLGWPVHEVVILDAPDSRGSFGYVKWTPESRDRGHADPAVRAPRPTPSPELLELLRANGREHAWRLAIMSMAGVAAQDLAGGDSWFSQEFVDYSRRDREGFAVDVEQFCGYTWDPLCRLVVRRTRAFADLFYPEIMAVSDVLVGRRVLAGDEVRHLIATAPYRENFFRHTYDWSTLAADQAAVRNLLGEEGRQVLARRPVIVP
jgi:hypothetical protein